jgi:hypothetical protein
VEVFDGEAKMYLHTDWKKFARADDIELNCLVNFIYEGNVKMSVKVSTTGLSISTTTATTQAMIATTTTTKKTRASRTFSQVFMPSLGVF